LAPALRFGKSGPSPLGAVFLACIAVGGPVALLHGASDPIPAVLLVGLTGIMAMVFTLGIADTVSRPPGNLPGDSSVPAIILLAAALCGLEGIGSVAGLSLREVAAGLVVMICAYVGGAPLGAAAGAVLGITYLISAFGGNQAFFPGLSTPQGAAAGAQGMAYVVAGMLAGTFRELRKGGVGIAFLLGFIIYAMASITDSAQLIVVSLSGLAAAVLFWFVPRKWLARLPAALGSAVPPAPREPAAQPAGVSDLSEKIAGMSRVFKEIGRTFEQVAAVEAKTAETGNHPVAPVTDRVCATCSMYRQCWEKDFDTTYQFMSDLWEHIEQEGPLTARDIPPAFELHCIRPVEVLTTLNHLYDTHRTNAHWERRLEEGRAVVGEHLRNVARMLDRFAEEVDSARGRPPHETTPALRVVSGVARMPKRGGHISGDSFAGELLDPGRFMLALSDGMGVGRAAAAESRQCVTLLREILRAGFATDVAVKTVNSALLLHSTEESFATVDLALLDLTTGRAEFVKVGAAPSFVKRGSDVTVVKMASVPVGIINQVQVENEFRMLKPGDIVVMITDGVWDVSKDDVDKERWLINHLRRATTDEPEEIAESILARALELLPAPGDDLTVLVARVEGDGGHIQLPERRPGATWVPVRRAPKFDSRPAKRAKE
ncbi:MAG TPA: SpoIIE family protein phosphatase, partial [Symbiobacteriaceae bacterium]|nr:SpoIIE family protein phosphatase [Symbiobacteriaceae bacterium]